MNEESSEVKEALNLRDVAQLKSSLDTLTASMNQGFAGIHSRQDTTNGRISTTEKELLVMKERFQYNKIIWYMFTAAVVLITLLIGIILRSKGI